MSDHPDDYEEKVEARDRERLELDRLYRESWACQETDPERSVFLLTRGRDEARKLGEPWWELFFEAWRLNALATFIMDYTRALPLAAELMVRFNAPEARSHDEWVHVMGNILYTYTNIDPFGYAVEIERGLGFMDGRIPDGPGLHRADLLDRWTCYLHATERWDEAYQMAMRSVALADGITHAGAQRWHGSWALYLLCRICDALGRLDEVADHAEHMDDRAQRESQLRRHRADAKLWRAVTRRAAGDKRSASAAFHRGLALLDGLEQGDSISADPIARYYEQGGDHRAALGVRDRELAEVDRKGGLHRACQLRVERCRLLSLLGELMPDDLESARQSAGKLREPGRFLDRIDRIGAPPAP